MHLHHEDSNRPLRGGAPIIYSAFLELTVLTAILNTESLSCPVKTTVAVGFACLAGLTVALVVAAERGCPGPRRLLT
jgi:hypothetical protein